MTPETDARAHPNVDVETMSPDAYRTRTLRVDFLFLDRNDCDRCSGTEDSLHRAIDRLAPLFDDLGVEIVVRNVRVETAADARRIRLASSPTIRIDGRDVQPAIDESPCDSCRDLCGGETGVDCRTWLFDGERHSRAPVALLVDALLRAAFSDRWERYGTRERDAETGDPYRLPENLRTFFEATERGQGGENETEPCC